MTWELALAEANGLCIFAPIGEAALVPIIQSLAAASDWTVAVRDPSLMVAMNSTGHPACCVSRSPRRQGRARRRPA